MRRKNDVIFNGRVLLSTLGLTGLLAGGIGCVAEGQTGLETQEAAVENHFYYRQQANQLGEMADRRRIEAEIIAQSPYADPNTVTHMRQLAAKLTAAAAEAEQKAFQSEQQIPHGMVPQ